MASGLFAAPALAQDADSDGDGIADQFDAFPCDSAAAGELYAPADGVHGTLVFEDQWPSDGDSDFNDAVLNYNYVAKTDPSGAVISLRATFNVRALGGTNRLGFGLHLPTAASGVATVTRQVGSGPAQPLSLSGADAEATFVVSSDLRELFGGAAAQINSLAGITTLSGPAVEVEVVFAQPAPLDFGKSPFDPYLFLSGTPTHEIHGPNYPGTAAMDATLFGTQDDGSSASRHFVNQAGLPFMLEVPADWVWPQEATAISSAYPSITGFASSGGTSNQDWYTSYTPGAVYVAAGGASLPNPTFVSGPRYPSDDTCVCQVAHEAAFSATGAPELFIVPPGVSEITVFAWGGAGGGSNAEGRQFPGGPGGFAQGTLPVTEGETLTVLVGQGGLQTSSGKVRAFPHGGVAGYRTNYVMGHGGGRSAVERGTTELVVAGGGGGAGGTGWSSPLSTQGGAGGGLVGGTGLHASDSLDRSGCPGRGGSQSAGGIGGNCGSADPGVKNGGGDGYDFGGGGNSGGGGGDGYYGGGAGVLHAGGGGGSGFLHSSVTGGALEGSSSGTQPPGTGLPEYATGVGAGVTNGTGGAGRVVIQWSGPCSCETALSTFSPTGADQTFTVPPGVVRLRAKVWGAAGGGGYGEGRQFPGGAGGFVTGLIDVTPGETLTIKVGSGGRNTSAGKVRAFPNGGVAGTRSGYVMGHGGGRSALERGGAELLVAGGGGGAGATGWSSTRSTAGGAGGGVLGADGSWATDGGDRSACRGRGGSQTAGGIGGTCGSADPGVKNGGGDGYDFGGGGNSGGAGGDGYFGGGAGVLHAGGGGGAGYFDPATVAEGYLSPASGGATPPNTSDVDFPGGSVGTSYANGFGGGGVVVILNHQVGVSCN